MLQQEKPGVVWASQGFSLYRSQGGGPFEKVFTIVPRFGEAWAGYLRTLRRLFGYQELVELLPIRPNLLVVFAGGDIYRVDLARGEQERVQRLRYFGRGRAPGARRAVGSFVPARESAPGSGGRGGHLWPPQAAAAGARI